MITYGDKWEISKKELPKKTATFAVKNKKNTMRSKNLKKKFTCWWLLLKFGCKFLFEFRSRVNLFIQFLMEKFNAAILKYNTGRNRIETIDHW